MHHRHLTHQAFTLAAIDDVIGRGQRTDWAELRRAVLADPSLREKVLQVCRAHIADRYEQRYHFWKAYVEADSPDGDRVASSAAQQDHPPAGDPARSDMRARFDGLLAHLESVAGWGAALPVQRVGGQDGILTGIRQWIRTEPLETDEVEVNGVAVTLPTTAELLRIQCLLILQRNAVRDYVAIVSLANPLGEEGTVGALRDFDRLYPQDNGESPLQQLEVQLALPLPFDLDAAGDDWREVSRRCTDMATMIFERVCGLDDDRFRHRPPDASPGIR
jgi:hypothetical protein